MNKHGKDRGGLCGSKRSIRVKAKGLRNIRPWGLEWKGKKKESIKHPGRYNNNANGFF